MTRPSLASLLNVWVILGSLAIAILLLILTLFLLGWSTPPRSADVGFAPADLTVIPAPTQTPLPTNTLTPDPNITPTGEASAIRVGGFVQISGTEGEGLRLRSAPGLSSAQLFLGYDSEVFEVRDGPRQADGYVWWYLVAPYDETRAGWAAADFLSVVPSP
jgi:hypothetical protein